MLLTQLHQSICRAINDSLASPLVYDLRDKTQAGENKLTVEVTTTLERENNKGKSDMQRLFPEIDKQNEPPKATFNRSFRGFGTDKNLFRAFEEKTTYNNYYFRKTSNAVWGNLYGVFMYELSIS